MLATLLCLVVLFGPWLPDRGVGVPPLRLSVVGSDGPVASNVATMVVALGRPNLAQVATGFVVRSPLSSRAWSDTGAGDLDARWTAYRAELVAAQLLQRDVPTAVMVLRGDDPGVLPGDLVTAVRARPVADVEQLLAAWYGAQPGGSGHSAVLDGQPVRITVRRDTTVVHTSLTRPWSLEASVVAASPAVVPGLDGVSGNSMGLATVLAELDAADPRHRLLPLTAPPLAVTGALADGPQGLGVHRIALVGRVADKTEAAVAAGYRRIMVPVDQVLDARTGIVAALERQAHAYRLGPRVGAAVAAAPAVGAPSVELVGVRTVEEAVAWLCSRLAAPGTTPPAARPAVCATPGVARVRPPRTALVRVRASILRSDGTSGL